MPTKRGFVLGKFMPPHAGHVSLCRAAESMADELTILVCSLPSDPIRGEQRTKWMEELFPDSRVVGMCRDVPQYPEDSEQFWPIWQAIVQEFHPEPIDLVFAGEEYGHTLAAKVGGKFIPILREEGAESAGIAGLSGTMVRDDPAKHWRFLPFPVRRDWVKVVALHGVESVGKSTLSAQLAKRLSTIWVEEHGRAYCETHGVDLAPHDLEVIAAGQQATIDAAREWSGPTVISDTDWLMTSAWSEMLFGQKLADQDYPLADLYLYLPPDLPWIDDGTRFFAAHAERSRFDEICREVLQQHDVKFVTLDAPPDARLEQAIEAISSL